jgi:hypothetical protein
VLAKEALSRDTEATIPVFLPGRHVELDLSRPQFESIIRAHVESTIGALTKALQSAAITPDRLSTVLLVGGSSQIPLVARMIEEALGCRTAVDVHPKHAVALGAAALSQSASAGFPIQPLPRDGAEVPGHPAPDLATDGAPAFRRSVPVISTESASPGRRRRGIAVAVGLLLLAGSGTGLGVSLSQHGAQHQQATGAGAPSAALGRDSVSTEAAALPTDLPGLINTVRADQTLAGAQTQPLVDQLVAVAASVGEARRQAALGALGITGEGGVQARLTLAVTAVLSPLTALDTPADMIADLQPDPALGGPNATLVLGCMREFSGHTPSQQQQEAQQILSDLPGWSANGGMRSDLADATVRIVTPVAQGQRSFTDVETSGPPPAPNGS